MKLPLPVEAWLEFEVSSIKRPSLLDVKVIPKSSVDVPRFNVMAAPIGTDRVRAVCNGNGVRGRPVGIDVLHSTGNVALAIRDKCSDPRQWSRKGSSASENLPICYECVLAIQTG